MVRGTAQKIKIQFHVLESSIRTIDEVRREARRRIRNSSKKCELEELMVRDS
jgi:hypothetical protein